jgi:ferric-dicitrate binding protein FerR (iron transport regulator)
VDDSRFDTLLERYQSGEATPAEVVELEKLLRQDAGLRTIFVEHTLLEVQLKKAFSHEGFASVAPAPSRSLLERFRRIGPWTAAAAAILVISGALVLFWGRAEAGNTVLSGQVAINGVAAGKIPDRTPFEVIGNKPALIRLADGSRAEVSPSSKAEIQGRSGETRQVVKLTKGAGKFQVTHGAGQFRVETPVGAVVALGTEFTVKLRSPPKAGGPKPPAKGSLLMAVTVTDGAVEVDTRNKTYKLAVGDRRFFDDDGEQNNVDDGDQNNQDDGDRQGARRLRFDLDFLLHG